MVLIDPSDAVSYDQLSQFLSEIGYSDPSYHSDDEFLQYDLENKKFLELGFPPFITMDGPRCVIKGTSKTGWKSTTINDLIAVSFKGKNPDGQSIRTILKKIISNN